MLCFTTFLVSLLVSTVQAIPLTVRDVYDPPVTSPDAHTVWNVGETRTVTWDVSSLPANLTNLGKVVLGFQTNDSENLMLDHPLAANFKLTDAQVQITVPDVPTRNDYIIVVFGDSGNASPQFTIQGVSSSTTAIIDTTTTTTTTSSLSESISDIASTVVSSMAVNSTVASSLPTTAQPLIPTSTTIPTSATVSITSSPTSTVIGPSSQASTSGCLWSMQSLSSLRHYVIGVTFLILWDFF